MNAPDKFPKTPVAPGVYVFRPVPANAGALRRKTAASLLTALRRPKHSRAGKSGGAFLKEVRDACYAR